MKVGVVGLGLLGGAIAHRLLAAGFEVVGNDIDPAKVVAAGVTPCALAQMPAAAEVIVLAVFTGEQAAEAAERLYATGAQATLVCTTTCAPHVAEALAARAAATGWGFVEAPISGTSAQVLAGQGMGLIAGAPEAIARADDVLAAICPRRHLLGRAGDAARAKLAVNLILGLNRAALAEGLVFAERMGLDGAAFLAVARDSAAYSQVMDTKGHKMLKGDYAAEGRAEQTLKDVHLMQAESARVGQPLPSLAVHAALLDACVEHGEGAQDSSVIAEELRRRGVSTRKDDR